MSQAELADGVSIDLAGRTPTALAAAARRAARALAAAVAAGFPAGGTVVVTDSQGELVKIMAGWACVVGERVPTATRTLYDLASLTKVVAAVTLTQVLAEDGLWKLDDPLASWLPGVGNHTITLRGLLTHTSGLPAHRSFYRLVGGREAIERAIYAEAARNLKAGAVCYSDIGFILLGWALESCAQMPLDELFRERVAEPLGLSRTGFRPSAENQHLTAATELDGDQRLEPGLVWGTVHDGNAWALGGVAGHAGLFGSADDLARFAAALLRPTSHPVLPAASIEELHRPHAGTPPDIRSLGWRLDASDWGPWPSQTFWHTGFTGGSLLVAPQLGLAVVSLLGGVHPKRNPGRLQALRREIHRELADGLV